MIFKEEKRHRNQVFPTPSTRVAGDEVMGTSRRENVCCMNELTARHVRVTVLHFGKNYFFTNFMNWI
jgi:hypothetical protein